MSRRFWPQKSGFSSKEKWGHSLFSAKDERGWGLTPRQSRMSWFPSTNPQDVSETTNNHSDQ